LQVRLGAGRHCESGCLVGAANHNNEERLNSREQRARIMTVFLGYLRSPGLATIDAPHDRAGEKPLRSIYDRVQCSAGPHRCDTLIVIREIVSADVHRFALRRQQLLRDLALGGGQRGGYRSEASL
jgi:hypothetical protein